MPFEMSKPHNSATRGATRAAIRPPPIPISATVAVGTQVREDEVLEHPVDILRRAPLVSDEMHVLLAPGCGVGLGQLDVEVCLVLPPRAGVRVPESTIALDVADPRQDEPVEVELTDAAY